MSAPITGLESWWWAAPRGPTVGRLADNGIVIQAPIVLPHHASAIVDGGITFLRHLGSTNGTFVDGGRVTERLRSPRWGTSSVRDLLIPLYRRRKFGRRKRRGSLAPKPQGWKKTIRDSATRKKKKLLADINLVINPGEFVSILRHEWLRVIDSTRDALSGRRRASAGAALDNGLDLYQSFDLFKPQHRIRTRARDIVHRKDSIHTVLPLFASAGPLTSREEIGAPASREFCNG